MAVDFGLACILALEAPVAIGPAPLARAVRRVAPRARVAIERRDADPGESAAVGVIDYNRFGLLATEGMLAESEIDHARSSLALWPGGEDALEDYPALAAIVALDRETDPVAIGAQASALTRLAAAFTMIAPIRGVYWHEAGVLCPADRLTRAVNELGRGGWPVDLWVGHRLFEAEPPRAGVGVRSRGAESFLGFEVEIPPVSVRDRADPARRLYAALTALSEPGNSVAHGQRMSLPGMPGFDYAVSFDGSEPPAVARLEPVEAERRREAN